LVATGKSSVAVNAGIESALLEVFQELATALIKDAEGATKFITVNIEQGATSKECLAVAYAVAESPLVKTALFASDPNWGRILAAVGRAGLEDLDIKAIEIRLGEVLLVSGGQVDASYTEELGQREMDRDEITLTISLGRGETAETVWTSDLSHDYIRINADYRS